MILDNENAAKGYRGKLDIVRDILFVADGAGESGSKKTHIMYGANLSYKLLTRYLREVLNAGLICRGESCYFITKKGKKFLEFYEDYQETRMEIEDHINNLGNGRKTLERMLTQQP